MTAAQDAPAGRALRADARRNRQRIVDATRVLFAEQGLEVPLEDIADRAGVGIATVYRRFPTREELVAAVFREQLLQYAIAAEAARDAADPWAGFCDYVEQLCAMQASDRGFADFSVMLLTNSEDSKQLRERCYRATVELIRRAQEAGALREDFVPEDLLLLRMATAGVIQATRTAAPHAWRRVVAYLLEGFRAERTGPLPAAPTYTQGLRAMRDAASAKGICPGGTGD